MSKGGYKIIDQGGLYYVSFAVVAWVDVFSRKEYRDILIESLQHCQREKGLVIYGWCIMSNHMHLIISQKKIMLAVYWEISKNIQANKLLKQ